MGLASSQARLLLLTSRKSDLEYKSQMISQRKIQLALQTEGLGSEYTKAMSNTRLMMTTYISGSQGDKLTEQVSYKRLTESTQFGNLLITDPAGNILLPPGKDGKDPEAPLWLRDMITAGTAALDTKNGKISIKGDSGTYSFKYKTSDLLTADKVSFQDALISGAIYIKKYDTEAQTENDASSPLFTQAITGSTYMDPELYTEDDAAAQAIFDQESRKIQTQDKMLDLELKNIETEHKAIETEYDSVKQVIQKNIETSYKIFANG